MSISTGIERRIDELGRIVVPAEIRRTLNLPVGALMNITLEGKRIILEKSKNTCSLCSSESNLTKVAGNELCADCIAKIKKAD